MSVSKQQADSGQKALNLNPIPFPLDLFFKGNGYIKDIDHYGNSKHRLIRNELNNYSLM